MPIKLSWMKEKHCIVLEITALSFLCSTCSPALFALSRPALLGSREPSSNPSVTDNKTKKKVASKKKETIRGNLMEQKMCMCLRYTPPQDNVWLFHSGSPLSVGVHFLTPTYSGAARSRGQVSFSAAEWCSTRVKSGVESTNHVRSGQSFPAHSIKMEDRCQKTVSGYMRDRRWWGMRTEPWETRVLFLMYSLQSLNHITLMFVLELL